MSDYRDEAPDIVKEFLDYHSSTRNHSIRTIDEYFLDLRMFFRFLKQERDPELKKVDFNSIDIKDVDLAFIKSITYKDLNSFVVFLTRDRDCVQIKGKGITPKSRSRKISTIRSFFRFLEVKRHYIDYNPVADYEFPKLKKTDPSFLSLKNSIKLLDSISGKNKERDYAIITLFLNCGLRISELCGLNLESIQENQVKVHGKGNKDRTLYLNNACLTALQDYLAVRPIASGRDRNALFLSSHKTRISRATVHQLVKKHIGEAGLDRSTLSAHKLRHTAATLMLQSGVDVRTLQEVLGHNNLSTTQIYTHVTNESLRAASEATPLSDIKRAKKQKGD